MTTIAPPPPPPLVALRCAGCRKMLGEMKDVPGSHVVIVCKRCGKRNEFCVA